MSLPPSHAADNPGTTPGAGANAGADLPARVALYCRVSTDEQAERQTIASQRDFLHRYCDLHGLPIAAVYADDGVSGAVPLADRPAGQRLLTDARAGHFGVVLVYRLDRLGRSLRALLSAHDALDGLGVTIRSATEPFDTSTPIGRFLFQLLGSIAELERETITERTTLGRVRVARDGRYAGGPIPFGYDLDPDRRLVPSTRPVPGLDMTEAELVADLFRRIASGSTLHAEAARMNALGVPAVKRYAPSRRRGTPATELRIAPRWTPARVWAIIHNPIYKGEGRYRARTGAVPYPTPPLVDAATWDRAQQQLTHNRRHAVRHAKHVYLLRLLITCAHCGRRYTGRSGRPRRGRSGSSSGNSSAAGAAGVPTRWYVCNGAGRIAHGAGKGCPGRSIDADQIEQAVWAECCAFIRNPGPALAAARQALRARRRHHDDLTARRQTLTAQLAEKERERERVRTLYRRGAITLAEAEAELAAIAQEIATLQALAESLATEAALTQAEEAQLATAATLLAQLRAELDAIEATDDRPRKQQIIALLVHGITVTTEGTGRRARVIAHVRYAFPPPRPAPAAAPAAAPDVRALPDRPADTIVLGRE